MRYPDAKDIKYFEGIEVAKQYDLLKEADRLFRKNKIVLQSMESSVRFKIPPSETLAIINYALAYLKSNQISYIDLKPLEKEAARQKFIQNMIKEPSLMVVDPILKAKTEHGYLPLCKFLSVFGGRPYRRVQFEANTPFSLNPLAKSLIDECLINNFVHNLCELRWTLFDVPSVEKFESCIPRRRYPSK